MLAGIPAERIHGIRVAEREGRLTEELLYPVPWESGKTRRIEELLREWRASQSGTEVHVLGAFGDSYSTDGPFLAWTARQRLPGTNRPVVVMINGGQPPECYRGLFREVTQTRVVGERDSGSR